MYCGYVEYNISRRNRYELEYSVLYKDGCIIDRIYRVKSVGLFGYSFWDRTEKGMAFGKEQILFPALACLNLASVPCSRDLGS